MQRSYLFVVVVLLQLLIGCAAMLVPETSDPAVKLKWAQELLENQDRPLPAERLITEAVEKYQEQKNDMGLAMAYRVYGLFFKSPSIVRFRKYYEENGFIDRSAKYVTRLQTALEYFEKSRSLLEARSDLSLLSNVYLQIGLTHHLLGQSELACAAFGRSLSVSKTNPTIEKLERR